MTPASFEVVLQHFGASHRLTAAVWKQVTNIVTPTVLYNLEHTLLTGSRVASAQVLHVLTPKVLLEAIEHTVPPGQLRSKEVCLVEDHILDEVNARGQWKLRPRRQPQTPDVAA